MSNINEMIAAIKAAPSYPITPEQIDLEMVMGQDYEIAKKYLIGHKDRQIAPTWRILASNGIDAITVTPFDGEAEKEMTARALRKVMREVGALRYTFMSECWMAQVDKEEWERDQRLPSQRDNRVEALVIVASDKARTAAAIYEMVRDREGVVIDLKRKDMGEGGHPFEGRFADLLREED